LNGNWEGVDLKRGGRRTNVWGLKQGKKKKKKESYTEGGAGGIARKEVFKEK